MAERRMLSKKITDSDLFLEMPTSSQALYLHLLMHCDDDGVCDSPKTIQRTCGASVDDFRLLEAKGFILTIPKKGIAVITHWWVHNYIQKDRYKPTIYQDEINQLELGENKTYKLNVSNLDTECIQDVHVDKSRLDKINIYNNTLVQKNDEFEAAFERFWSIYPKKQDKKTAKARLQKALKETDIETIIAAVEKHKLTAQWQKNKGQFIPLPSTWLHEERWNDEVDTSKPKSNNNFNNFDQHGYDIKDLTRRAKE